MAVNFVLIKPDGGQMFNIGSQFRLRLATSTESGTYYLLVDGDVDIAVSYGFR